MKDTITTSETIDLWGWGHEYDSDVMDQRIFGHLVRLAAPVVKEYHGDLFHDALWVRDNINGPTEFLFCVRHSGTNLGPNAQLMFDGLSHDAVLYRLSLSVDERGRWTLRIYVLGVHPSSGRALPESHHTVLAKCDAELWRNVENGDAHTEGDAAADIVQHLTVEYDLS